MIAKLSDTRFLAVVGTSGQRQIVAGAGGVAAGALRRFYGGCGFSLARGDYAPRQ